MFSSRSLCKKLFMWAACHASCSALKHAPRHKRHTQNFNLIYISHTDTDTDTETDRDTNRGTDTDTVRERGEIVNEKEKEIGKQTIGRYELFCLSFDKDTTEKRRKAKTEKKLIQLRQRQ